MHHKNISDMYSTVENNTGFDAIIVVSSTKEQAEFWKQRLNVTSGTITGKETNIISVEEDWPGGAGQLLGTLYAWNKAQKTVDLNRILQQGGSVAMYHTAGKGTRMAPIPAVESNNKSSIKLPRLIEISGMTLPLTILEAVIFQTGIFADSRQGRLCVFWGDQVFIPSNPVKFCGISHAEILDIRAEVPSQEEQWKLGWQSYGLIIPSNKGESLQREKQNWNEVQSLIEKGTAKPDENGKIILGKSLGCFTVSVAFLSALLEEYNSELLSKTNKLDTDPHLWMPLTSTADDFVFGGGDPIYWDRVNRFKERFISQFGQNNRLFGDIDIGSETLWWDYGQLKLYHSNTIKAIEESFEGDCIRQFYDLEKYWIKEMDDDKCRIINSIIIDSSVSGLVSNCVIMNTRADNINVTNSVILNSILSDISADEALIYNGTHLVDSTLEKGTVVADMFIQPHGRIRMTTNLDRDGKDDWETVLSGNQFSFEELTKIVSSKSY